MLTFEVEVGPQGKKRSKDVQFVRAARKTTSSRHGAPASWSVPRGLALPVFIAIYAYVPSRWAVSPWVAGLYGIASVLAFFAYALDKSAARGGVGGHRSPRFMALAW